MSSTSTQGLRLPSARPFTVYFDTSFWIWLGSAPKSEADEATSGLEALGVRYVLSEHVLSELALAPGRGAQYERMTSRVERLSTDPLRIPDWATWDLLFGDAEAREQLAEMARIAADTRALVGARSIAVEKMTPEQAVASNVAIGLPADPSQQYLVAMLRNLREQMRDAFSVCGPEIALPLMPEPTDSWDETIAALLEWSAEVAQHELVTAETDRRGFDESVTKKKMSDLKTLAMRGWDAAPGKLSNAFRDGGHMATFAAHEEVIDVLQLDGENFDGLRTVRGHEIVKRGLQSRCFRASNLLDAVAQLEAYRRTGAFRPR